MRTTAKTSSVRAIRLTEQRVEHLAEPVAEHAPPAAQGELHGDILTPNGFLRGRVRWHGGRIVEATGQTLTQAQVGRGPGPIVLPGFIDLHVHGGQGSDTMDAGDAAAHIARAHARHGTTALLATTMTAPREDIVAALRALAPHVRQRPTGGARILGVHLEGPFINRRRLGAQPDFVQPGTLAEVQALHALAPLKLITLAPEVPGHLALIGVLRKAGFRVQIGHSSGCYEDGLAALQAGAAGFTHLFNAMSPLHHREPGMVGAALAHAEYAEIIPDLLHVHPGAIRAALRAIPCLYCVTDSTSAAGMPDGEYRLGRHRVTKCLGAVRLPNGSLAGSTLTMDQALRNLVGMGLSLAEASHRTATFAARYLGIADRGTIEAGAHADLVALDADLVLRQVWVEGEPVNAATRSD
jgi:N-acetylglucosamine-6-phosphate deacetylase